MSLLHAFDPRSAHVRIVVDKVALEQISSEHFSFLLSFHRLFHTHHHPSSGADTAGVIVTDVPSTQSHPIPQTKNVYNGII
jgi:hypothetical protein